MIGPRVDWTCEDGPREGSGHSGLEVLLPTCLLKNRDTHTEDRVMEP